MVVANAPRKWPHKQKNWIKHDTNKKEPSDRVIKIKPKTPHNFHLYNFLIALWSVISAAIMPAKWINNVEWMFLAYVTFVCHHTQHQLSAIIRGK